MLSFVLQLFFAFIFFGSGVYHFIKPDFFMPLMPPVLPAPKMLIYLSGLVEIVVAVGLFVAPFRQVAVWGVIALLIVFTPIHIFDYFQDVPAVGSKSIAAGRLVIQLILIAAAFYL